MMNLDLAHRYNRCAGAHKYIVGFAYGKKIYYITIDFPELCQLLHSSRTSSKRGGVQQLRIYVKAERAGYYIQTGKATELCDESELRADTKHNKGENFERIITELLTGTVWVKDSTPFWKAGDINLNGEEVQIKLNGAELTNEKAIATAEAAVAA